MGSTLSCGSLTSQKIIFLECQPNHITSLHKVLHCLPVALRVKYTIRTVTCTAHCPNFSVRATQHLRPKSPLQNSQSTRTVSLSSRVGLFRGPRLGRSCCAHTRICVSRGVTRGRAGLGCLWLVRMGLCLASTTGLGWSGGGQRDRKIAPAC